jgi:hypothetical protein
MRPPPSLSFRVTLPSLDRLQPSLLHSRGATLLADPSLCACLRLSAGSRRRARVLRARLATARSCMGYEAPLPSRPHALTAAPPRFPLDRLSVAQYQMAPTVLPHKKIVKKRTLHFKRHQSDEYVKVKDSWRRPRGIDSRERRK